MARKIRSLRHWKQRFDKNARFIFRKTTNWDAATVFQAGDEVPVGLLNDTRLRRFWESGRIELAEFDEPRDVTQGFNPKPGDVPPNCKVEQLGGNWYRVEYGGQQAKLRGKAALGLLLTELTAQLAQNKDPKPAMCAARRAVGLEGPHDETFQPEPEPNPERSNDGQMTVTAPGPGTEPEPESAPAPNESPTPPDGPDHGPDDAAHERAWPENWPHNDHGKAGRDAGPVTETQNEGGAAAEAVAQEGKPGG